jgi:hypothetical protein
MNEKIIMAIAAVFMTLHLSAQFSVGLKIGTMTNRTSTLNEIAAVNNLNSYATTAQFGIVGQYHISDTWSIHSGISYTDRSTDLGVGTDLSVLGLSLPVSVNNRISVKSVDIPLSVAYNYTSGRSTIYPHVGVIGSIVSSGNITTRVNSLINLNVAETAIPAAQLNKTVFYGSAALGYAYNLDKRNKIFSEVQYNHALEDATSLGILESNINNKGFSVGIGYAMSF